MFVRVTDKWVKTLAFRRLIALLVAVVALTALDLLAQTRPFPELGASQPLSSQKRLVESARSRIGKTLYYDPAYVRLDYPMGDVAEDRGVCTDVVVRAFRSLGVDLQKEVHVDMKRNFAKYPKNWGLSKPDKNIDHRRVPNLKKWFQRQGKKVSISQNPSDYLPGDIVTWDLGGGIGHIGIVSDKLSADKTPLVIHNMGSGTQEDDLLFGYKITGHYRYWE